MSKKAVISTIVVCLLLALAGGGVLGWMYLTRDRAAVATYRLLTPEGASMVDIIAKETELMKSDAVLNPVIKRLELTDRWKLDSDGEALARIRTKLIIRQDLHGDRVRVVYRDRNQERALEVLEAINAEFAKLRHEAAVNKSMPPIIPLDAPDPNALVK